MRVPCIARFTRLWDSTASHMCQYHTSHMCQQNVSISHITHVSTSHITHANMCQHDTSHTQTCVNRAAAANMRVPCIARFTSLCDSTHRQRAGGNITHHAHVSITSLRTTPGLVTILCFLVAPMQAVMLTSQRGQQHKQIKFLNQVSEMQRRVLGMSGRQHEPTPWHIQPSTCYLN
jgi:hypothetical protein